VNLSMTASVPLQAATPGRAGKICQRRCSSASYRRLSRTRAPASRRGSACQASAGLQLCCTVSVLYTMHHVRLCLCERVSTLFMFERAGRAYAYPAGVYGAHRLILQTVQYSAAQDVGRDNDEPPSAARV